LKTQSTISNVVIILIVTYAAVYGLSRILSSVQVYFDKKWFMVMDHETDLVIFQKRAEIDLAHYENPKFQDLLQRAFGRGWWPLINLADSQFRNFSNIAVIIATSAITSILNWQVYLVVIISSIPMFYVQLKYGKVSWTLHGENSPEQRMYDHLSQHLRSRVGIMQSKTLQNSKYILEKMSAIIHSFMDKQISIDNKRLWSNAFASIVGAAGYAIAFYLIVFDIIKGNSDIGSMVFLVAALGQLVGSISALFSDLARQFEWSLYVTDIFEVLNTKPFLSESKNSIKLNLKTPPKIEFKNVYFKYPDTKDWVLENINLEINPGEKIALVGENGAGKTTLIKLLARIYDPDKGQILINGIDLKEINYDEWGSYLGILLQDFINYQFVVTDSIAMGRADKEINLNKVIEASVLSGASDFIEKWDEGYKQRIGKEFDGGVEPSKGQNQKLALARILYRAGFVTVLDEPTASVDALSEMKIFESMQKATKDLTLIVITHRFNAVQNLDKIIVLEHGVIVEVGNHNELFAKKGRYAEMYLAQAKTFIEQNV